jgi:hypothetical protein
MSDSTTALALMKMALALLDKAGAIYPACHLQAAINGMENAGPMIEGDAIDTDLEARILGPLPSEAATALPR